MASPENNARNFLNLAPILGHICAFFFFEGKLFILYHSHKCTWNGDSLGQTLLLIIGIFRAHAFSTHLCTERPGGHSPIALPTRAVGNLELLTGLRGMQNPQASQMDYPFHPVIFLNYVCMWMTLNFLRKSGLMPSRQTAIKVTNFIVPRVLLADIEN